MKKIWTIGVEQNDGEYMIDINITAENVIKTSDFTVNADGVEIEFDSKITIF